jgi:hypothetical protein
MVKYPVEFASADGSVNKQRRVIVIESDLPVSFFPPAKIPPAIPRINKTVNSLFIVQLLVIIKKKFIATESLDINLKIYFKVDIL